MLSSQDRLIDNPADCSPEPAGKQRADTPTATIPGRKPRPPAKLTPEEQHVFRNCLAFLSLSKQQLSARLTLGLNRQLENLEHQQQLFKQAGIESRQIQILGLIASQRSTPDESPAVVIDLPYLRSIGWLRTHTANLEPDPQQASNKLPVAALYQSVVVGHLIYHGLFQQLALVILLGLSQRGDLYAAARLFKQLLQEQNSARAFSQTLLAELQAQHPELTQHATRATAGTRIGEAINLATHSLYTSLPQGLPGINAPMLEEYLHFLANDCCLAVGLPRAYPESTEPLSWAADFHTNSVPDTLFASNH